MPRPALIVLVVCGCTLYGCTLTARDVDAEHMPPRYSELDCSHPWMVRHVDECGRAPVECSPGSELKDRMTDGHVWMLSCSRLDGRPYEGPIVTLNLMRRTLERARYVDGLRDGMQREYTWLAAESRWQLVRAEAFRADRKHGHVQTFHRDGSLEVAGDFVDGQPDGTWYEWRADGLVLTREHWQLGVQTGAQRYHHANGQVAALRHFDDEGRPDGEHLVWDERGALVSETHWTAGLKDGPHRVWGVGGRLLLEANYAQGWLDGRVDQYAPTSWSRRERSHWQRGQLHGSYVQWHDNGLLSVVANYDQGRRHGELWRWHENGQLAEVGFWHQDRPVGTHQRWTTDGEPESRTSYVDGLRHGRSVRWSHGQRVEAIDWVHGQRHGEARSWTTDGRERFDCTYANDDPVTCRESSWHDDGQLAMRGSWARRQRAGDYALWFDNGQPRLTGQWDTLGRPTGTWTWYHRSGAPAEIGEWVEGVRHGAYRRLDADGELQVEGAYTNGHTTGIWRGHSDQGAWEGELVLAAKVVPARHPSDPFHERMTERNRRHPVTFAPSERIGKMVSVRDGAWFRAIVLEDALVELESSFTLGVPEGTWHCRLPDGSTSTCSIDALETPICSDETCQVAAQRWLDAPAITSWPHDPPPSAPPSSAAPAEFVPFRR